MDKFLSIARKFGFLKTIPEAYNPDSQAILEYVKCTGEILAGVEFANVSKQNGQTLPASVVRTKNSTTVRPWKRVYVIQSQLLRL